MILHTSKFEKNYSLNNSSNENICKIFHYFLFKIIDIHYTIINLTLSFLLETSSQLQTSHILQR